MKNAFYFIALTAFGLAFSCKSNCGEESALNLDQSEFIFTKYFCECGGACISGYRVDGSAVYPGSGQGCMPENLKFDQKALEGDKFVLAAELRSAIPASMLAQTDYTWGCPDCGDWGGYFLQLNTGEKVYQWRLDLSPNIDEPEVKAFVKKMEETIEKM